jgi:hypothetical protein
LALPFLAPFLAGAASSAWAAFLEAFFMAWETDV